jgi:hypothetical protein
MLAADGKQNILPIYSDDHGWADLGAQGVNREIRTPNLDQFAPDGVRFARGYVVAPQCVPSRSGVLTEWYQQRFGVEDNAKRPLKDFTAENSSSFGWPASADWQEVKVELPVKGRLIHLRLTPAKESAGLEVQSIELRGHDGEPQVWHFNPSK